MRSLDLYVGQVRSVRSVGQYAAFTREEMPARAATWVSPEDMAVSQTRKGKCCAIPPMRGARSGRTHGRSKERGRCLGFGASSFDEYRASVLQDGKILGTCCTACESTHLKMVKTVNVMVPVFYGHHHAHKNPRSGCVTLTVDWPTAFLASQLPRR